AVLHDHDRPFRLVRGRAVEVDHQRAVGVGGVDEGERAAPDYGLEDRADHGVSGGVCRWHAAKRPGATSAKAGRASRQIAMACSHLGWNGQPPGGDKGEGSSPWSGWKWCLRRAADGIALISAAL